MSKGNYNLIVTAHPDDETIFFGGLILSRPQPPWKVICVTDANADGQGGLRRKQFQTACRQLGIKSSDWLGFPDIYDQRLDVEKLSSLLQKEARPKKIFTHGILGEYGHPHHQDVSYAVHKAFPRQEVYSVAWNCFPHLSVKITKEDFRKKLRILTHTYGSETQRFLNLLPATAVENFIQVSLREVEALYQVLSQDLVLQESKLKVYKGLSGHLEELKKRAKQRAF